MAKRKKINVSAEQALTFWTKPAEEVQLSIIEPEVKEKKKKEQVKFQRRVTVPEEALEQFIDSLCFAECLFKAHDGQVILIELHPHRMPSGWLWDCRQESNKDLPYKVITLTLPRLSEAIYTAIWSQYCSFEEMYGSRERVYAEIGLAFKRDQNFTPYAEELRAQLRQHSVQEKSA